MNTSTTSKPQPSGKTGQSSFSAMSASSILHDKVNGDRRRATPDSEAMASSEDENDNHHHENAQPAKPPVRRASWLNDPNIGPLSQPGRKNSFASNSMSPTTSHPSTPSAETGTWGSHAPVTSSIAAGRSATASSSFPWGQGIWTADSRKEPPSRLSEIPLSPTAPSNNYGGGAFFSGDNGGIAERSIPIEFPLHPTPKTYRSQSYSVGQMDAEANNPTSAIGAPGFPGRGRGLGYSALQHRPSKPSMLSEMTSEGLGKLKEVEDDEEENDNSLRNSTHSLSQMPETATVVEQLMRENAMLRQQQQQNLRLRPKSATINTLTGFGAGNAYGLNDTLPEESGFAIDENDEIGELQDIGNKGLLTRRMSEFEYGANAHARGGFGSLENRKLETLKKAHWQSSLGFGGPSDLPPSRRHSFADVPTRHQSISSIGEPLNGHNDLASSQEPPGRFNDADYAVNDHRKLGLSKGAILIRLLHTTNTIAASSYFGGASLQRNQDAYGSSPYQSAYNPYAMQPQYGGQPSAPHRNIYNVPQPRHNQMLYIVLFKCSRADVFYVQEGTGLSVKPGDLVIVEADRGTDLGTVAQDNVDWATAKELKEQYAEEHYKWLMMYSQGAVGTQDGTGAGLMAASNGLQGSAVGGMGPPTQHGMQEPNPGELKPKIIKRLAQNHEIQALRDKEGNEAKAKRVCMQKVKEHGLHMEILDAEFQMQVSSIT